MSNNPYAAPMGFPGGGGPNTGYASGKVAGPAVGLMVTAGIGIALQALGLVMNLVGAGMGAAAAGNNAQGPEGMQMLLSGGVAIVSSLIGIAGGVVVLLGAMKMKKLESFGFAMAAAIVAIVPCISPCCVIGVPVGIWALVVLNDAGVKSAFR